MNVIITLLTVFEVIVCLLLSLLVLMQRPRQEGLGAAFGSGVTDQMFGAQTTNVLQKATVYFGVALFGLTFLLAILVSRQDDRATGKATFVEPSDKVAKPVEPAVPASTAPVSAIPVIKIPGSAPAAPTKVEKTAPSPVTGAPATAKPADNKPAEKKVPAPAAPAADKPATPAPKPATPALIPTPTTSSPAPSVPAPAK